MASHKPEPTFASLAQNQIAVAKTLVIACADPRSDPAYILGLKFGGNSLFPFCSRAWQNRYRSSDSRSISINSWELRKEILLGN